MDAARQRTRWFTMVAVAVLTLAATAVWTAVDAEPGTAARKGTASVKLGKPIGGDQLGFALGGDAHELTIDEMNREFSAIRRTGARWVRMDINWDVVQREGPDSGFWDPFDHLIGVASSHGIKVLATIVYSPPWARPADQGGTYGPRPRDFARFAKLVVERYAPRGVHAYELWNEPNHPPRWTPAPNPRKYARLLKAAYPVIKKADPKSTVLTGGTSPGSTHDTAYSPVDWLAALYANGAKGSFDAVSHHPTTFPGRPGDPNKFGAWYQMYGTHPSLRSVMRANGDAKKKIWGTEFGAPTNGGRPGTFVSEAKQAKLYVRAVRLWSTYPWAGKLIGYQVRDAGTATNTRENFFGILRRNFSPKPVVATLRRLVARR